MSQTCIHFFTNIDSKSIRDNTVFLYRAERSAAQSLRQQQDQAYEESLRADQEKDRKREEERRAREEQEAREQEQLNAQELEIQRIRHEKELTIRKVPLEPESSNPHACHLQIKFGERTMIRRFHMSDTLEVHFLHFIERTSLSILQRNCSLFS